MTSEPSALPTALDAGSSASKPFGTLKYQVGAISRRLRTVSSISPGSGLRHWQPSSGLCGQ